MTQRAVAWIALGLAGGALVVPLAVRSPGGAATPPAQTDDVATLRLEVQALRAEVRGLEAALRRSATRAAPVAPASAEVAAGPVMAEAPSTAATKTEAPSTEAPGEETSPPRYTRFTASHSALQVRAHPLGGLQVTNADPELTGQIVTVEAETEDGRVETVRVTVPAPDS